MPKHDKPSEGGRAVEQAGDEPFLTRWSRLKTEEGADGPLPAEQELEGGAAPEAGESEPPAIDPADLPDIESLDGESDYTAFMQEGVPDELRKLALRKLFMSNPALSVLDGLNDYDDDYSMLGIVAEKVKTAYQVGRGFLQDEDLVKLDDETEEEIEDQDQEDAGDELIAEIAPGDDGDSDGEGIVVESDASGPDRLAAAKDGDVEGAATKEAAEAPPHGDTVPAKPAEPRKA